MPVKWGDMKAGTGMRHTANTDVDVVERGIDQEGCHPTHGRRGVWWHIRLTNHTMQLHHGTGQSGGTRTQKRNLVGEAGEEQAGDAEGRNQNGGGKNSPHNDV